MLCQSILKKYRVSSLSTIDPARTTPPFGARGAGLDITRKNVKTKCEHVCEEHLAWHASSCKCDTGKATRTIHIWYMEESPQRQNAQIIDLGNFAWLGKSYLKAWWQNPVGCVQQREDRWLHAKQTDWNCNWNWTVTATERRACLTEATLFLSMHGHL